MKTLPPTDESRSPVFLAKKPRKRKELIIFLLPNLFTTANFFCGFFSLISSMRGDWVNAAIAIIVAAVSDGLDGRIARLTHTESEFGEQYDSLADLLSFGVAPAILTFQWALAPHGRLGWLAAFLYATCAALRLARFNVLKQSTEKRYFQGCPSPVAACGVASAVLFYTDLGMNASRSIYILLVTFLFAGAMISTLRYRSFKDLNFKSQKTFGIFFLVVMSLVVISASPERLMFPLILAYILWGVVFEFLRFVRTRERERRARKKIKELKI